MKAIRKADGTYIKGPEFMLPKMLEKMQSSGIECEIVEMNEWDKHYCPDCGRGMVHDGDHVYYCEHCEG